jgi:hypothetical protein
MIAIFWNIVHLIIKVMVTSNIRVDDDCRSDAVNVVVDVDLWPVSVRIIGSLVLKEKVWR